MCGMIGGTKEAEYERTVELLLELVENQGLYFAIALLYDSGYTHHDLDQIMETMVRKNVGFTDRYGVSFFDKVKN